MPLVHFSYREDVDASDNTTPTIIKMKIKLPRRALSAQWRIKKIEALSFHNTPDQTKRVELYIPELMVGNHVMYSLNSDSYENVPERRLRFYFNNYSADQTPNKGASHLKSCISTPDLDMGYHVIDNLEMNIEFLFYDMLWNIVSRPYSFNVILEYNE